MRLAANPNNTPKKTDKKTFFSHIDRNHCENIPAGPDCIKINGKYKRGMAAPSFAPLKCLIFYSVVILVFLPFS